MRLLLTIMLALLAAGAARADSWLPPSEQAYPSANGEWRVTVTPAGFEDASLVFDDVDGNPAVQTPAASQGPARARLERRTPQGWTEQWSAPLVNDVAPTSALVSDNGRHLVTFDNWFSAGWGDHVVVLYTDGRLVRSLKLGDMLPDEYIRALPHTTSSIWWSGRHRFAPNGRTLNLAVVIPSEQFDFATEPKTVNFEIDLATAAVHPPTSRAWQRALAAATRINRKYEAAEATARAAFLAPLTAPRGTSAKAWRPYAYEALQRLVSAEVAADYDLLLLASGEDGQPHLRYALTLPQPASTLMIAAPGRTARLRTLLQDITAPLAPTALNGTRIYLLMPPAEAPAIAALLTARGATVQIVDPAVPIPQRPDRITGDGDPALTELLMDPALAVIEPPVSD